MIAENNLDEFSKKKLEDFKMNHPTAKVKVIQNGYHYLPLTNPREVAAFLQHIF